MLNLSLYVLVVLATLGHVSPKCAYRVLDNGKPEKVDAEPHIIEGLTQCVEYNGKLGCCDVNNDNSQVGSYEELDGVFSTKGGGCDICAINLKRFWCEYACSPRQTDFMITAKDFVPVPDPKDPDGPPVQVQKVKLTVHADTACLLYNSCKRVGFVSSVSAMSTPAGFLNFLGHNGVDDAFQYIDVDFSYETNNSLYFNDDKKDTEPERAAFDICNRTKTQKDQQLLHGFKYKNECSCNNCEDSCGSDGGFVYTEPQVFQGFNWQLVLIVWGSSIAVVAGVTFYRSRNSKEKQQ